MRFLVLSVLLCLPAMALKNNLTRTGTTVKSFKETCSTSPTQILDSAGDNYTFLQCSALGATPIFLGGSAVTTTAGYPICTDPALCGVSTQAIGSNGVYCRVASGTEELRCIAVVE